MRGITRSFGAVLAILAVGATVSAGPAGAAEPTIDLEGPAHVLTFTSPPVYDVSESSSSYGSINNVALVDQDLDAETVSRGRRGASRRRCHG